MNQLTWNENDVNVIFYKNVPKLELLASSRTALFIWRNTIIDYSLKRRDLPSSNNVIEKFDIDNVSLIPSCLRGIIIKRIRRVRIELKNWLLDPFDGVNRETFASDTDTWIKYFDLLVWNADYTINYLATCKNLLRSERISDEEKFVLVCSYCLADEISILWGRVNALVDSPNYNPGGSGCTWLVHYWINNMKNSTTSDRISDTFDEDDMLLNMPLNPWAVQYFLPYLGFDNQNQCILSVIFDKDVMSMRCLLPKLSVSNLLSILSRKGSDIIEILIVNVKCRPLAIQFWDQVKYLFDEEQFFDLVKWMLVAEIGGVLTHVLCEAELSLCEKIFTSAPNRLKEYALNHISADDTCLTSSRWLESDTYRNMKLLKMVLVECNENQKNKIWNENWFKFCIHARSSDIDEIMLLCIESASKRIEFKKQVMMNFDNTRIEEYCYSLLDSMNLHKLNEVLKICSPDLESSISLKQRVIRLYFSRAYFSFSNEHFKRIDEFMAFLDESFTNAEESARLKKNIMWSSTNMDRIIELLYDGDFTTIKKLVDLCLSSDQDLIDWKKELVGVCYHCLSTAACLRKFNPSDWQEFMLWCVDSEEKLMELKKSLSLDDIFEVFLESYEDRKEARRESRDIFEKFLKWCLISDEDVLAFKRKYIEANPNDCTIRRMLLGRKRKQQCD